MILIIRRLRCINEACNKIHHELPDIITPYKRQTTSSIEKIIVEEADTVPVENSTIKRIREWFRRKADAIAGGLLSTYVTVKQDYEVGLSDLPQSILQRILLFVGHSPGSLKKEVRI